MKWYNIFYILFLELPVFSMTLVNNWNTIKNDTILYSTSKIFKKLEKRAGINQEYEKAYLSCAQALESYDECIGSFDYDFFKNINYHCNQFKSNKCQTYYKEGLTVVPECRHKLLVEDASADKLLLDFVSFVYEYTCTTDENGNECPYINMIIDNIYSDLKNETESTEFYEKRFYSVVNETCYSNSCTNNFLMYIRDFPNKKNLFYEYAMKKEEIITKKGDVDQIKRKRNFSIENYTNKDENTIINETITYLQSEECRNKFSNKNVEVVQSNAYPKQYNNICIIYIICLLSLFIVI